VWPGEKVKQALWEAGVAKIDAANARKRAGDLRADLDAAEEEARHFESEADAALVSANALVAEAVREELDRRLGGV